MTALSRHDDHQNKAMKRRSDMVSAVDRIPWWVGVMGLILAGLGSVILIADDYSLAWERITPGIWITIRATISSFVIALIIGLAAGLGLVSKNVVARTISRTYVEFIRGIPILVLIFTVGLVIVPEVTAWLGLDNRISPEWRAIFALSMIYGAYMAEIIRGGIQAVPPGQFEAGRSVGLTERQTMRSIILPQAARAIIPPLGNDFIAILKDTSLLSVLGVLELTLRARQFASGTFKFRPGYLVLSVIYLTLTLILSFLLGKFEQRMSRDRQGAR